MRIPMDLIFPEEEAVLEVPKDFSAVPAILAAAVVIIAAVLIIRAIKKKK